MTAVWVVLGLWALGALAVLAGFVFWVLDYRRAERLAWRRYRVLVGRVRAGRLGGEG